MKFSANQKTILRELSLLAGVTRAKNATLQNVLISVSEEGILLEATNGEISIRTTCSIDSMLVTTGKFCLPCKKLIDILSGFDNISINFELQENKRMRISAGKSVYNLAGEQADHFPAQNQIERFTSSIPVSVLIGQIERGQIGMSEDNQALRGVDLVINQHEMLTVSADGNMMPIVRSNITFPDE